MRGSFANGGVGRGWVGGSTRQQSDASASRAGEKKSWLTQMATRSALANLSLSLASLSTALALRFSSRNLDNTWNSPQPSPCGRIAAVECPPTSLLGNSNTPRTVWLTYSLGFLIIIAPCAIFEVLTKVKLHCTNCQSLARLSPVFSALKLCVPDLARAFSHRHSVCWWSHFAHLGGTR